VGLLVAVLVGFNGYRHSVEHVRYMSGTRSPSLNCIPCHVATQQDGVLAGLWQEQYLSPLDVEVSRDGAKLYVTAEDSDLLLVVDAREGRLERSIPVGRRPHTALVTANGSTAYVSNRWSNSISVVDLASGDVVSEIQVGIGPSGMAFGPDETTLYVANTTSNSVSLVDLAAGEERMRLVAGRNPYAVALAPDDETVYVTSRLSRGLEFREPPAAEVTVIDVASNRVADRLLFEGAHVIEGIDFTPSGDWALVSLIRPKNLLPATQIGRGWMQTFGIGIVERDLREDEGQGGATEREQLIQLLLDDVNAFFADPYDVAVMPDGRYAFVSHAGADVVTVVDLPSLRDFVRATPADSLALYANHLGVSGHYVVKRIPTGPNPKSLAVSPDGRRLYLAERAADRIAVIDTERLEVVDSIDLGGPERVTMVRRGMRLFHSADHTFQGQFSCRSCHPEGHHDALTYDLEPDGIGLNVVNNLSLRGLSETSPYKWTGKNVSLYRQCGFRFAKWLTRTEPYAEEELHALVAYIMSLSHAPNRFAGVDGELTPAQERGKALFERDRANDGTPIPPENRCISCHPPPLFTNLQKADVGSKGPTDTESEFDTPSLNNLYDQAPFLHDGRAMTLEEVWTKYGGEDNHGVVNDLTKSQLNDLMAYLNSIGGAQHGVAVDDRAEALEEEAIE
jgi:YVTN family beta-propeller protein